MLNYFRINDFTRLIVLAIVLLAIRLPFYIFGEVVSEEDLRFLLLGEKVASGKWLYSDILTSVSLFSGLFYGAMVWVFGKSLLAFHLVAYLVTVLQVYLFNRLVTENRATISQTYFPGLFYGIFISIFPGSFALSPFLLGQTFLLIALNYQFNHLEFKVKRDEKIILIGILISIYSLFEGAASLFIVTAYLVFVLYTNTLFRRYLLMGVGFLLPYFIIWGLFAISGNAVSFFRTLPGLLDGSWNLDSTFMRIAVFPLFFLILFLRQSILGGRFTNYQVTLNFAMLIWALFSIIVFWLSAVSPARSFVMLVPLFALYGSHFFIAKKSSGRSVLFGFLFVGAIIVNTVQWNRPEMLNEILPPRGSGENRYLKEVTGKKVWYIGPGFQYYDITSSHASEFFDWKRYSELFTGSLDYQKIRIVFTGLQKDFPQVIIDPDQYLEPFMDKVPELRKLYQKRGDTWVLVSS